MSSFFEPKPAAETIEAARYDLDESTASAIVVTSDLIERKLDISRGWTREARAALQAGDLPKHDRLLCLAKTAAEEAIALMQSAELLFGQICDWE